MSQNDAILAHLQTGAELTPLEALRNFGCLRLAARIFELRCEGVPIAERIVRDGAKHWAAYRLALPHG